MLSVYPKKRWQEAKGHAPVYAAELIHHLENHDFNAVKKRQIAPLAALLGEVQKEVRKWKMHLYGSANAWMTFVGASPGGSPTSDETVDKLLGFPRTPTLGWPHPSFWYPDGRNFIPKIRKWAFEAYSKSKVFQNEYVALSNLLMLNLASDRQGNAGDVESNDKLEGAKRFWNLVMPVVQSRLVIALQREVFKLLRQNIPRNSILIEEGIDCWRDDGGKPYYPPWAILEIRDIGRVMLASSGVHPSRPIPTNNNYEPVYEYLAHKVTETRSMLRRKVIRR